MPHCLLNHVYTATQGNNVHNNLVCFSFLQESNNQQKQSINPVLMAILKWMSRHKLLTVGIAFVSIHVLIFTSNKVIHHKAGKALRERRLQEQARHEAE